MIYGVGVWVCGCVGVCRGVGTLICICAGAKSSIDEAFCTEEICLLRLTSRVVVCVCVYRMDMYYRKILKSTLP